MLCLRDPYTKVDKDAGLGVRLRFAFDQMNAAVNSNGRSLPDAEVRREGEELVLALKGEWSLKTEREVNQSRIFGALEKEQATHAVRVDISGLKTWDTSLLKIGRAHV